MPPVLAALLGAIALFVTGLVLFGCGFGFAIEASVNNRHTAKVVWAIVAVIGLLSMVSAPIVLIFAPG